VPSHLGWVDFTEADRQRMLDVISLFREQILWMNWASDPFGTLLPIIFSLEQAPFRPGHAICSLYLGSI